MIDLHSDTHTLPTEGMRRAMASAEVGDEQLGEDPTTNRLQERVAELLGTDAALFMPTGSMCNKVAISALTRPGDAVICDHRAHVYRFESGGPAVLSSIIFEPIITDRGHFTPDQLRAVLNQGSLYQPPTSLVSLEQTHNFAGGTVWPIEQYEAVCDTARRAGASIYTDGARLLNAVAATGIGAPRWAGPVDAIWIDFSKGLGAPGGAAIAGSTEFIALANRFKYLYGGAMRQSGILAAAALYGLDHHLDQFALDNDNARRLAAGLAEVGLTVEEPESNMVFFRPPPGYSLEAFVARMSDEGVRGIALAGRIRLVTHLDVTGEDVDRAVESIASLMN
ncbi:MAG TPA: threonine aldolase family protein [Acidimicrobiia bacterium]|nr:threonine aldolase family protein [Acidimicrobiia bacterium]